MGIPDHGALQRFTGNGAPKLLIQGDADQMIPTKLSNCWPGLIPDAKTASTPTSAHAFLFQEPHEVAVDITAFPA